MLLAVVTVVSDEKMRTPQNSKLLENCNLAEGRVHRSSLYLIQALKGKSMSRTALHLSEGAR